LPVYVDFARHKFREMIMCHMVADSLTELHDMADEIGMRRVWFQAKSFPHYDLSQPRRRAAVILGAIEVDRRQLVTVMRQWREGARTGARAEEVLEIRAFLDDRHWVP
jgi:hypothetical protein